jgi:branched-chain amino acid transport system permease protein
VLLLGIMQELLTITFGNKAFYKPIGKFIYAKKGLSWAGTLLFLAIGVLYQMWKGSDKLHPGKKIATMSRQQQMGIRIASFALGLIVLLLLPRLGTYPSEILTTVGIYIIMGLGLNIVVGYAGLLDLGYVAFFAIGAYTVGILNTTGKFATTEWGFWAALPVAVFLAMMAGVILGIPVLKMRGDYLAIVTLGFGEIIRVLVLSDWLKPFIGGAQGILQIPKPHIGSYVFKGPQQMYYIVLGGILLVGYVAWRLRDARVGRAWKALREDEDVAEAMGIHLVSTKLMAFATGAAFAGLAGAIFAAKLGSIFPHSFNLIVSINVLSLIIVGGIGSLPGVVVGALILVGMPELLREFADYRMLFYGALLVVMMLVMPEGFVPEKTHARPAEGAPPDTGGTPDAAAQEAI